MFAIGGQQTIKKSADSVIQLADSTTDSGRLSESQRVGTGL